MQHCFSSFVYVCVLFWCPVMCRTFESGSAFNGDFPEDAQSRRNTTALPVCHHKNEYFTPYWAKSSPVVHCETEVCLPLCVWIEDHLYADEWVWIEAGETCFCGAREGAACRSVPLWARGPRARRRPGDKRTEGSGVTSCPCVDETMPSVNKPKLASNDRGWLHKRQLFEIQYMSQ